MTSELRYEKDQATMAVSLRNSSGSIIQSVEAEQDSWKALAPPQKSCQWKDGYSAKELAKLWFRGGTSPEVPQPFLNLFNSAAPIRGLEIEEAICEMVTRIDSFGGKHRHHDQILVGQANGRRTVVGVEAKSDEEFGPIIKEYLSDLSGGARLGSRIPERIELLAQALFGKSVAEVASLRYQLLHAFAGTIIEAKQHDAAQLVFMVCEFVRASADATKHQRNHCDFEAFIKALPGQERVDVLTGQLMGPVFIPGGEFVPAGLPAFLGKVTIKLNT